MKFLLALGVLILSCSAPVIAAMSSSVELHGKVADFNDRYVFIDAVTERYKIKRGAVPDSVELRPGSTVRFALSLDDLSIIPATAPMVPKERTKPLRHRVPSSQ